ncbi:adenylosuccinate synthase [Tenuibacillus multivorans]|uniref:Adenylosuccinate synthetase n=1 Tax=Tenuibacillus multivorans TaxID=237069 RepID=A0A1G9W8L0_9BACI|nr:adenylosuccinate synthase [Tenuibacillus multivorans]GEL76348.1 adenylosuccinate synthetase [Tenuibacillus multivorans]SDM80627.1 adenylosuccinate synthase [Tenuibacillus multivorans]
MTTAVIVGTQWGDEGKGKITDFLAQDAKVVARYQGGDNAGHTIQFNQETYKLHLIPSGIFNSDKVCVLGNGMVINPKKLLEEMEYVLGHGMTLDKLKISNRSHVIMPYHIKLDYLQEESKGQNKQIGTTKKGIGPAYSDKINRIGIQMADLLEPDVLKDKIQQQAEEKNIWLEKVYGEEPIKVEEVYEEYIQYGKQLKPYIEDTSLLLEETIDQQDNILFEGAQGVMLDVDQGTYPYVTSSNTSAAGVATGSGIGPNQIQRVVGVSKAYTTRVGDGPFPTELHDEIGEQIRKVGHEYGTTTGRARRVGWFDIVVARHAKRISGMTDLSLNCLDVLSGLDQIKICIAYDYKGEKIETYPANLKVLENCKPIYEEMPGWKDDIRQVRSFDQLPLQAQNYVKRLEELIGTQISIFSVGPDRDQTVIQKEIY